MVNKFLDRVFYSDKIKEVKGGKYCGLWITYDSEPAMSLGSSLLRLGKDKILWQVVRNQTEDGVQTEFRKYRVKGKMLSNSACLTYVTRVYFIYMYTRSHKHTQKQKKRNNIFTKFLELSWAFDSKKIK